MEQHKTRLFDRLRNACTGWTGKIIISCGTFFLLKTLTEANIAAISLIVVFVFGILGIFENNPTGWKRSAYIMILIICSLLGGLIWWNKYHFESNKNSGAPIIISISQENSKNLTMTSVDADRNKSELTVILKNFSAFDISSKINVRVGIFPHFGSYNGNKIKWFESESKQDIPSGLSGQFIIKHAIEEHMAIVVAIEGKEFPNGLLIDEQGILYTWNYWQYNGWTNWQRYRSSVTQTPKMEMALDKFKRCAREHTIDRNYSPCFEDQPRSSIWHQIAELFRPKSQ